MIGKVGFACKFMHEDQNLKPKQLTPNFKNGSEASQIPFSMDFLFDR